MKSRNRSLSGALIAVLALPVFLGLLACIPSFPVPIGDAEKSRIDPNLSGMWIAGDSEELAVWWFVPYDKRTWIMTWYSIEVGEDCEPEEAESDSGFSSYQEIRDFIEYVGLACFESGPVLTWKTWKTELGGRQFLTMENKSFYLPDEPAGEQFWMVYGVDLLSPDVLRLTEMDSEDAAFADIDGETATRRQYERVFRKQAKKPEFYDSDPEDWFRVPDDDVEMIGDIVLDYLKF